MSQSNRKGIILLQGHPQQGTSQQKTPIFKIQAVPCIFFERGGNPQQQKAAAF